MNAPLHILHVVSNLEPAGLELTLARVVAGLNGPDMRHSICCLKGEPEIAGLFDPSVDIHCLHARHHEPGLWRQLRTLIRRLRPSVVHARNWSCWPDSVRARLTMLGSPPLVMSFHGFENALAFSWRRRLGMRTLARFTTSLFTVSESFKEMLVRDVGLKADRLCVIPNGVDVERFSPQPHPPRAGIVVGAAGWLHAVKNHRLLIDAARKLIAAGLDLTVRIAGRGELRDELAAAIGSDFTGRIQLLGHVEDMPAFLRDLDIFVLPSDAEGLPNALLEAMACGLPCIATNVGGAVEVLGGGQFGVLVPPRDVDALAGVIRTLSADSARPAELARLARERVCAQYSLPQMIHRYDALYRRVAAGESPSPEAMKGATP